MAKKDKVESEVVEEKVKVSKEELNLGKIEAVEVEEQKVFDNLIEASRKYESLLSSAYTEMDAVCQMVCAGISNGALIWGEGGTGKTFRCIKHCVDANVEWEYLDSFATPASLYAFLYKNKDKDVLLIDDLASFLSDVKILAFLKAALWASVGNKRIVNYESTKIMKDEKGKLIPKKFEMNARIIIITNSLDKKSPHIRAVLSRINEVELDIPRDELLRILEKIAESPYEDLDLGERMQVFRFLKDNTSNSTEDLNIRTMFKLFQYRRYAKVAGNPNLFDILGLKILKRDETLVVVEALLNDSSFLTEDDRINKFVELTKKTRATYYRLKKRLTKQGKSVYYELKKELEDTHSGR